MNKLSKILIIIIVFLIVALGLVIYDDIVQRNTNKDLLEPALEKQNTILEQRIRIEESEKELNSIEKENIVNE